MALHVYIYFVVKIISNGTKTEQSSVTMRSVTTLSTTTKPAVCYTVYYTSNAE